MEADSGSPRVRVHVASLNTAWATELCVRSAHQYAGYPFELVVGDAGSTDGSLPMLRRFEARGWLQLDVAAGGRRHAEWLDHWVRTCDADYAVFADSDVEFLADDWLRDLVDTALAGRAALVCQSLSPADPHYVSPINGDEMALAARPSPWLMMVDTAQVRPVEASFAFQRRANPDSPGGTAAFDVGAAFLAELDDRGLPWTAMPRQFADKLHHYGGLSWLPGGRGTRRHQASGAAPSGRIPMRPNQVRLVARQLRKIAIVRWHLSRLRRLQPDVLG